MKSISLSIKSIAVESWGIFIKHWQVLVTASLIPLLLSLAEKYLFPASGGLAIIVSFVILVLGFLVYIFQTLYVLRVRSGHPHHWNAILHEMTFKKIWRLIRANVWMVFVIVWPAILMVMLAYLFGVLVGQNSFTGTTISVFVIGISSVVASFNAFMRSLKYALAVYLGFTTNKKVTNLTSFSRTLMRGNRIKLFKLVFVILIVGIGSKLSIVLVPIAQPLIYIALIIFAERVIEKYNRAEISENEMHSQQ